MPLGNVLPQNNEHKIVRFTNVSNFDFTPEMGAMFGGVPYFVPAGKSLLFPLPVGEHLATHLARQILIKKSPIRDGNQTDGKGSDRPLWDDQIIHELKAKIVSEMYEEEKAPVVNEADRMRHKVEELNTVFPSETINVTNHTDVQIPTDTNPNSGYADKAQVIEALKARNIAFDARKSKASLEQLLK